MMYVIKDCNWRKSVQQSATSKVISLRNIRCLEIRRRGNTREMYRFPQYQNSSRLMILSTNT